MSDYDEMGLSPISMDEHEDVAKQDDANYQNRHQRNGCIHQQTTEVGDAGQHEHREDPKPRMIELYDEAKDARECKWKNEEPMEVVERLETRTRQIKQKLEQLGGALHCFSRGQSNRNRGNCRDAIDDDESDEGEGDKLVCNMTGQKWEALPCPVVVDSGASASVMPEEWCPHVPTTPTKESEQGEFFRAANGNKIYNQGQKMVTMMTQEGAHRDMRFTICDVSKALASVSQMCRSGNKVVFNPPWNPEGSYIQHVDTGERLWLREENGLYMLDTRVAPINKQTSNIMNQGSTWPVSP